MDLCAQNFQADSSGLTLTLRHEFSIVLVSLFFIVYCFSAISIWSKLFMRLGKTPEFVGVGPIPESLASKSTRIGILGNEFLILNGFFIFIFKDSFTGSENFFFFLDGELDKDVAPLFDE